MLLMLFSVNFRFVCFYDLVNITKMIADITSEATIANNY